MLLQPARQHMLSSPTIPKYRTTAPRPLFATGLKPFFAAGLLVSAKTLNPLNLKPSKPQPQTLNPEP